MWYEAAWHGRGEPWLLRDGLLPCRWTRTSVGRWSRFLDRAPSRRTEWSGPGIILAYLEEPSAYAVARAMGVSQQTVTRCLQRAAELGVLAALDDRARTGRDARITAEARTWLVGLACAKPTQFGYPHELWTTRLLAAHARDHGPRAGHPSLANLAQGTVCKILAAHEVKPHKVRYYLERRDPEFEPKMAEVLCVYREVEMRRAAPVELHRSPRSRSSPMTRNPASRRSAPPLPTFARCLAPIRRSAAITSTSAMERSPRLVLSRLCAKRSRATVAYAAAVPAGGSNGPPPRSRPR